MLDHYKTWVDQKLYFRLFLTRNMLGDAMINMTAGMILGMAVCPIMMKAIKNLRQNIRVNRILREISDTHKES
ncbi:MAG: hypothetical protein M3P28_07710 [Thermoproteota archaeon]|nr:hypothetical protein [Thermoproteota archaeon]